ncbi:hypothetical protein O4H52_01660 [Sphingomonadaceae bacterium G21617-S1]|nr:hypothetical protein [Sphingomonadaceae bacterium G21617-S1]
MYHYRMAGLAITSEIPLPSCMPLDAAPVPADVLITLGPIDGPVAEPNDLGERWTVDADRFVWDIDGVGRLEAFDGRRLRLDPAAGVLLNDATPYLMGTTFAALLYQRGEMLLHASAVAWKGHAYLLCGTSGQGKSTLAATLCAAGSELLSDDICRIEFGADIMVHPDGRLLKLFASTVERLGWQHRRGGQVLSGSNKYFVDPPRAAQVALPLGGIYALGFGADATRPAIDAMSPLEACDQVLQRTYRRRLAYRLAGGRRMVGWGTELVRRHGMWRLSCPFDLDRLTETAAILREHWERGRPVDGSPARIAV